MSAWLSDVPGRRCGVKGPRAAAALEQLGFSIPAQANTWMPLHAEQTVGPAIIGRLGNTEYFLEEPDDASDIGRLEQLTREGFAGAYAMLREDCALLLGGSTAGEVLAQVCNVNLPALDLDARPVVMTLMIGVGVLVVPQPSTGGTIYRIWCDPSYGTYLREELEEAIKRLETGSAT